MTGRFHLTLATAGRPVMHGWWGSEAVARGKFTKWVGKHGHPDARVVLIDEEEQLVLASWPDEPDRLRH